MTTSLSFDDIDSDTPGYCTPDTTSFISDFRFPDDLRKEATPSINVISSDDLMTSLNFDDINSDTPSSTSAFPLPGVLIKNDTRVDADVISSDDLIASLTRLHQY